MAALGVSAMLVACASPYGEADSIPLPERTGETTAQQTTQKKTVETPAEATKPETDAPLAQVVAGPPSSIAFTWNEVSPTAEYSLDVLRKDGVLVAPCISVEWIHRELTTTFRGACPSSDAYPTIAMTDIEGFQLCSA